ncbi:carbohydrate sulfotransferase 1 [Drosophila bipectinata]|uniref:carbohydrate sulfotransferase 1 n=1 Tax=Drosophila bipectinata TaxID=42026 RepID=UPI0038B2A67E
MVQVSRTTKFTGICIGVYVAYAVFIFFLMPLLMPDPVALQRSIVAYKTRHLGDLSNYTMETGGQPIRSMLVTFRGSGALTLLDNLANQPGCYQHYAPLIGYRGRYHVESQPAHVLKELDALFNCNYNSSLKMIRWGKRSPIFRRFYGAQSKLCMTYSHDSCWDPENLAAICRLHPFMNMAVYNMKLKYLALLLDRLNLRILLLVRDPRGTMYSRKNRNWCEGLKDCEATSLCEDMVSDFKTAQILREQYRDRFSTIRYEDLANHPAEGIKQVFEFYGIPLQRPSGRNRGIHPRSWISHDGYEVDIAYGTNNPNEWMRKMQYKDIKDIQKVCGEAMDMWGYRQVEDFDTFSPKTFEPMLGKA